MGSRLKQHALAVLRLALMEVGWRPQDGFDDNRLSDGESPDLLLRNGQRTLAVELAVSPGRARRAVLRGQLADAVLRSKAYARRLKAAPLAVVASPAISDEIAGELARYIQQVASDIAWGLIDERGRFELHGEGLEGARPPAQQPLPPSLPPSPQSLHNPFSDLGQWMLKVLLARRVSESWLNAPRRRIRGVADLAEAAQVSPASASRFLAALDAEGFVVDSGNELHLARIDPLLHEWRRSVQRPTKRRYARFLLPQDDPLQHIQEVLRDRAPDLQVPDATGLTIHSGPRGRRACLGLFAACRALGVGIVTGAPIHLLCEELSPSLLKDLGLIAVEHRAESELILLRPRFPEAVFRGCVSVEGAPVADILQCWLDVSFHPARGEEQADEIAEQLGFREWSK